MGRNSYFRFKQFTVRQEKSAMKVGTDGILLGAWTRIQDCKKILDVGTGTGLIALMLAQRSEAEITAIEIERNAATEAEQNVKNSPWEDRINVQNISFQEYAASNQSRFDLIVSNPPFFNHSLKAKNRQRRLARHSDSLPLPELVYCSEKLLKKDGRLAVILPVETASELIKLAGSNQLYLHQLTKVYPNREKPVNRFLMEFSKEKCTTITSDLCIENLSPKEYSEQYTYLVKDYYLLF